MFWVNADVPEARADLLHAIYDRIVVKGRSIVAARLTPAAYSNGWPLLCLRLSWRARRASGAQEQHALP